MKTLFRFLVISMSVAVSLSAQALLPANMDSSVSPCNEFYHFANGGWLKNNPVPNEQSVWSSFNELAEKNNQVMKAILEETGKTTAKKGTNQQRIGDFYHTGMDSTAIERAGATPLRIDLDRIMKLKNSNELQAEIALHHTQGISTLFRISSGQDEKNSTQVIAQITQSGLGLPDRDYYLLQDEKSKKIRTEYQHHVKNMFMLTGTAETTAEVQAEAVLDFETRLARASYTRVERRDSEKNYNKMGLKGLSELAPAMDWKKYFDRIGAKNVKEIDVGQPPFITEAGKMMQEVPLTEWKVYLQWKVISAAAPYLSSSFVDESFRFNSAVLRGTRENQPRWKRVLGEINRSLGEALGELYVNKVFPPEAKSAALAMVKNVVAAFGEHIGRLDWMDDSTKAAALHKLSSFTVKIGYPDVWKDYSALNIERTSYFENVQRSRRFAFQDNISRIGKPVDRQRWGMTPQTVNAYYNSNLNEIVFPAAILQPPFFDMNADDAVNYGGMGAVIGHELTHGFDDEGSKYDAEGNLKSWWSEGTRKRFEERTNQLAAQFDQYVAIDSLHVNGKLTNGENIADLGGLSIAYTALQKVLDTRPNLHLIDGFTPGQRFFLAWAQIWRRNYRDESLRLQVRTDPHSPGIFRTNGPLSNMPQFYEAFSCSNGVLVRPPNERVKIW